MQLLFSQMWVGVVRKRLAGSPADRDRGFPPEREGIGSASPSVVFQSRKRKHPLIASTPALSQKGPELAPSAGESVPHACYGHTRVSFLQANQTSYTPGKG